MLRPEHEILSKPFPVAIEFEDTKTPDNFKMFEPDFGDTVKTFSIFREKFSEPGLVTSNHGFEDSPDAERILGGINMKGPRYAAVARHGSFVMWGFQGRADGFTPAGERLFLNAIAYAAKSRGRFVESLREYEPRDGLGDVLFVWRKVYEEQHGLRDAIERTICGERVPEEVVKDREASKRWFEERRPFLRKASGSGPMAKYQLEVDAECKALGVGNSDEKFLAALIDRLEKDPKDDLATKLVKRYVPGVEPQDLKNWVTANEGKLYFTETGGYEWRAQGQRAKSVVLRVEGMSADDPVRIEAQATSSELSIVISIRSGWHLYPPTDEARGVQLRIGEGSSFALAAEFSPRADARGEITGYCDIRIPLKRVAPGDSFVADLIYTVCNLETCRPPRTIRISR